MVEYTEMLGKLAATKSATDKKAILREYMDNANVRRMLFEAMCTARVFNIKDVPAPSKARKDDHANPDYQPVFALLDALDGGLKGKAAKAEIDRVLGEYTPDQQSAIIRTIRKDLKVGVGAPWVNEVAPGLVPVFPIALADKMKDVNKVEFPVLADIKYDGYRMIAKVGHFRDPAHPSLPPRLGVRYFSREGREGDKYNGWFDAELLALRERYGHDIAVDGEALGASFSATQQARGSDGDEHIGLMKFYVFTVLPLDAFEAMGETQPEMQRTHNKNVAVAGFERLAPSEGKVCHNVEELLEYYAYAISKKYEGLILKRMKDPYSYRRNGSWLKWKPVMADLDGQVIGVFEGEKGSAVEGNMGGVIVRGTNEEQQLFECRMGSGFDLRTRTQAWADHTGQPQSYRTYKDGVPTVHTCLPSGEPVIGRWVEMEGQEFTKALDRDVYSVRFPVFKRWRGAK